ncbi:hypothetical protein BGX27_011329 [Mortierella sp. AM989]|nr:hypothetical protein BGX27_011329 [Mortierella sp. AM989]
MAPPIVREDPQENSSGQNDHEQDSESSISMKKDPLGQLYKQIGSMARLKVLDLKRQDTYSESDYQEKLLPRLLTLRDDELGATGCLSMLAGLTELRELRGSVRGDTSEMSRRMGQQEVEWMAEHRPSLEVAEFLQDDYGKILDFEVPAHLKWLQEQRPRLRLCCQ